MTEQFIELPRIRDSRGNLSFFESMEHIPFEINRTYWIYDVPGGESRGGHALHYTEEFIIALSGSFDVITDDGKTESVWSLNRSYIGLYLPAMTWRRIENFSTNSFALVVASKEYSADEYIRNYKEYSDSRIKL